MIRVAICDDNSAYVDILYDYVCKYAYENNIDINIKQYVMIIKYLLIICHKLSNPNLKDRIMKILS